MRPAKAREPLDPCNLPVPEAIPPTALNVRATGSKFPETGTTKVSWPLVANVTVPLKLPTGWSNWPDVVPLRKPPPVILAVVVVGPVAEPNPFALIA